MQAVIVHKNRRMSRGTKLLFAILGITVTALGIAFMENGSERDHVKDFWQNAFSSLGTTLSLQTVESYSPAIKYGIYSAAGNGSFSNWEMTLLSENLGRKQNFLLDVVQQLSVENENNEAQEASNIDDTLIIDRAIKENDSTNNVGMIYGESYFENGMTQEGTGKTPASNKKILEQLKSSKSLEYLLKNFYIIDGSTSVDKSVFNVEKLLKKDCTMKVGNDKPQILIFHTHGASESFADSDGTKNESVVGVGAELAKILTEKYGYNVIHDEICYDAAGDRNKAYDYAFKSVEKTLKKYPSIEVTIDLHRDGTNDNKKRAAVVDGKSTAQIMFFNGLSRLSSGHNIDYIKNPNLQANLAFSLQMKMKAMELYPNITTKIYCKKYRYNLQLREKSTLIELGNEYCTIAEAKNAMGPLAEVLNEVLNE